MAGNLQLYSLLYVSIGGAILCQEASVTVKRMTGAQIQKTVALGFAGVSPGSNMCTVSVKNAVPSKDFELDPGPYMASLAVVEVGIVGPGGQQAKAKGFILEDTVAHSVDNPTTLDFEITCQMPQWVG